MIDRDAPRRINHAVPLPSLIGSEYNPRRSTDTQWFSSCPFHEDSTASFSITYKKDRGWCYNCFGCGEVGDVVKFIQKYHGLTFKQVLAQYGDGNNDKTIDQILATEAQRWFDRSPDWLLVCDRRGCMATRPVERGQDALRTLRGETSWECAPDGIGALCPRCSREPQAREKIETD